MTGCHLWVAVALLLSKVRAILISEKWTAVCP